MTAGGRLFLAPPDVAKLGSRSLELGMAWIGIGDPLVVMERVAIAAHWDACYDAGAPRIGVKLASCGKLDGECGDLIWISHCLG